MKQSLPLLACALVALFLLAACGSAAPEVIPVDTIVAMTLEARPRTDTPPPPPSEAPTASPTAVLASATPSLPAADGMMCIPQGTERNEALVTRVLDGDTIEVAYDNAVYTVQYLGVNAPDLAPVPENYSLEASTENKQLVGSQKVVLVRSGSGEDKDTEGRLLRYVLTADSFANYEMVRSGLGQVSGNGIDLTCQQQFLRAEEQASNNALGLWAPTATPTFTATPPFTPTPLYSPTPTSPPPCDCEGRVSCNSFGEQAEAQACFAYCKSQGYGDVFGMDNNRNGLACEGLP